ncbi:MAG: peptide chain release factor N(5)-glutamine methyltransferase [Flavitalea sp.]
MKRKSIKFVPMTIQQANQRLLFQLYHVYDNREAANIADWVMEHITGWRKIDRILYKEVPLTPAKLRELEQYGEQLAAEKPVQYVLQEAWFYAMKLFVNESTLIPRPETEELAAWLIAVNKDSHLKTLDVGTGSGCLAIAIKKNLPDMVVYACDISQSALEVAAKNAQAMGTPVSFLQFDFTNEHEREQAPEVDIIVSNPPYIPYKEKSSMRNNVTMFEPSIALFVDDDDPLVFYKAIAGFATKKLSAGGNIFLETHEGFAAQTAQLFIEKGFSVEIRKDMQGKERMIRCS